MDICFFPDYIKNFPQSDKEPLFLLKVKEEGLLPYTGIIPWIWEGQTEAQE